LSRLRDITPPELVSLRVTWANNGLTTNRKLSRLMGFFALCIQNGSLIENPAKKMKRATVQYHRCHVEECFHCVGPLLV
jgi:hypothetical protein